VKYNLKKLLEEKDKENENKNRFQKLYADKNKIIFYDELYLYQCYFTKESDNDIEIKDIEYIKNSKTILDTSGNKTNFKINNNIIISFNNDEEGSKECKNLTEKYQKWKDSLPKNYEKYNLNNILNYVEKI
jgi:hypothetical protein